MDTSLLNNIRALGPYQIRYSVLLLLATITHGIQNTLNVFLQGTPPFWCSNGATTNGTALNLTVPSQDSFHAQHEVCSLHADPKANCTHLTYNLTYYGTTGVTKWDLVCDADFYPPLAQTLYMLGYILGCVLFTALSDHFGRKMSLYVALMFVIIFGTCSGTADWYASHVVTRMFTGAGAGGVALVAYVMVLELLGTPHRLGISVCTCAVFTLGVLVQDGASYITMDFVTTNVVASAMPIFLLAYWWILPESIQWLVSAGRITEAQREVERAATMSGVSPGVDLCEMVNTSVKEEGILEPNVSILSALRTPHLRRNILVLLFVSLAVYLPYYGLLHAIPLFDGDPHLLVFLMCIAECIAYCTVAVVVDKLGRRLSLVVCMAVAVVGMASSAGLLNYFRRLSIMMLLLGKLGCGGALTVLYVYGVEIFPVIVRTQGFAAQAIFAHVGALLAPFVVYLAAPVWKPLPIVLLGSSSLAAGLLSLLLPETLGLPLSRTLMDGEIKTRKIASSISSLPGVTTPLVVRSR